MECKLKANKNLRRKNFELIETLWNVNVIIDKHDCVVAGINRNIVECKLGLKTMEGFMGSKN